MKKLTWKHWGFVWIICFEVIISWARHICYFRWDFLQEKEGEGKNPPPALLSTPTPLLQCHRQLQINPVLQPHGKWIQRAKLPQLLLSRTAEQESRGCCLQLDSPQAQAKGDPHCQMSACALSSTENTWASWTGITPPRDGNNSSWGWHMARPNKGATETRQLVVLPWGVVAATQKVALTPLAIALSAPFSYTEHKQHTQLTLLSFFWNPLSPFIHSEGKSSFWA